MAHSEIDPTAHSRRRLGCVIVLRDPKGRVLMVDPAYRPGLILPGGAARDGETIADAAARELHEETGLVRELTHLVTLDQVPADPETGSAEGLNVVLDGGTLTEEETAAVALPESAEGELLALVWVPVADLDKYALPYQARRVREAVAAIGRGDRLPVLLHGERVSA
ncbi:NUDIX domain-containing protein [Kitasatospora sp. McL0602]|uniref:NUDIX domain-containing protein n=1 Tax=Kitasatospora sp. McL0602 TaxID=3439530 RepID=UPI003F89AD62